MKKLLFITLALILFISCEKESNQNQLANRTYVGTYQRHYSWTTSNDTAKVTIVFSENEWTGTSSIDGYPALCHGTFALDVDTIIFEDDCVWPDNTNLSFLLNGKYFLVQSGDTLEFSKNYSYVDGYSEIYKLVEQK